MTSEIKGGANRVTYTSWSRFVRVRTTVGVVQRPMVVTRIHVGVETRDVLGLLDSGADNVSTPRNIADAFQIPYDSDRTVRLDTSSGTASANICAVRMEVLGFTEPSSPVSCEALIVPSSLDFILLGRSPWFEQYQIGFNGSSGGLLFAPSSPRGS